MRKRADLLAAALLAAFLCMGCSGENTDTADAEGTPSASEENVVSAAASPATTGNVLSGPSDTVEAEEAVAFYRSVFGSEWSYIGIVDKAGDAYYGSWIYEDEANRYYYMPDEDYLVAIESSVPYKEIAEDDLVSSEEVAESAEALFRSCNAKLLMGECNVSMSDFDGEVYSVEIVETVDGYETGTKALLLYWGDGSLSCAVFIKGNLYEVETEALLTEAEAIERAVELVNAVYGSGWLVMENEEVSAQLKTTRDQTYWQLEIRMNREQTNDPYWFYVRLDAYTGGLIDMDIEIKN